MTHIIYYPILYITVNNYWSGASVWIKLELQSVKNVSSLHKISRTAKFNIEIRRNRLKLNTIDAFDISSRFIWNWLFPNISISDQVHPDRRVLRKNYQIFSLYCCYIRVETSKIFIFFVPSPEGSKHHTNPSTMWFWTVDPWSNSSVVKITTSKMISIPVTSNRLQAWS